MRAEQEAAYRHELEMVWLRADEAVGVVVAIQRGGPLVRCEQQREGGLDDVEQCCTRSVAIV